MLFCAMQYTSPFLSHHITLQCIEPSSFLPFPDLFLTISSPSFPFSFPSFPVLLFSYVTQYGETAQITLGVVGGTPKKTIFRPLDTLVKTRDHETIRSEIKGPLMLAPVQVPQSYTALSVPGIVSISNVFLF